MTLFSVCERIHNSVTTMHERSWRVVNAVRLKLGVCQNIVLYVLEVANLYSSMYSIKSSTYKRRKGWIIWPKNRGKAHSRVWRSKDGPPFLKALTENAEHFEEELNKIPCKFIKKLEIIFSLLSHPNYFTAEYMEPFSFVDKLSISGNNNIYSTISGQH